MQRYCTIILLLLLCSCSRRIVENTRLVHDTTYVSLFSRDSVFLHDSIYVKEQTRNDTVYISKYVDRYVYKVREVHDTISLVRVDSLRVEAIREVKVSKPLSLWQRARIWAFPLLLGLCLWAYRKKIIKFVIRG